MFWLTKSKVMGLAWERDVVAANGIWLTYPEPFGICIKTVKKGSSTKFKLYGKDIGSFK